METTDVSLQGIAGLVFVTAGVLLTTNIYAGTGLVILAVAILVLKAYLNKKGINIQGRRK